VCGARVLLAEDDVEVVREQASERRTRLLVRDFDPQSRVALGGARQDRTPRPAGSSKGTPVSVSSWLSCWEIADGL
jgi:hypothetical protein